MININILREYMNEEQNNRVNEFMAMHGISDNANATCKRYTISGDRTRTVLEFEGVDTEGLIL